MCAQPPPSTHPYRPYRHQHFVHPERPQRSHTHSPSSPLLLPGRPCTASGFPNLTGFHCVPNTVPPPPRSALRPPPPPPTSPLTPPFAYTVPIASLILQYITSPRYQRFALHFTLSPPFLLLCHCLHLADLTALSSFFFSNLYFFPPPPFSAPSTRLTALSASPTLP